MGSGMYEDGRLSNVREWKYPIASQEHPYVTSDDEHRGRHSVRGDSCAALNIALQRIGPSEYCYGV